MNHFKQTIGFLILLIAIICTCMSCGNGKAERMTTCYEDQDHDGYSSGVARMTSEEKRPEGFYREYELISITMVDCNDQDPSQYPGNNEIPDDGIDQDCSGKDLREWYMDKDRDGYSVSDTGVYSDEKPEISDDYFLSCQLFEIGTDPDDTNPDIHPDTQGCEESGKVWEGDCEINYGQLSNLTGYSEITGNLWIRGYMSFETPLCPPNQLFPLRCLKKVGGDLYISVDDSLTSLHGLSGLTEVGGSLILSNSNFCSS